MKSFLQLKLDMEAGIDGMLANETKKISFYFKEVMMSVSSSDHHMFSIPLEVSINSGNNWGEAH